MGRRLQYVAAERDPLYLHALRNRFLRTPNVSVAAGSVQARRLTTAPADLSIPSLCINVLEYVDDPAQVLDCCARALKSGGR